jgi:hypothetical protein
VINKFFDIIIYEDDNDNMYADMDMDIDKDIV